MGTKSDEFSKGFTWQVASDLALEAFGDKAVVLLAMRDSWITINRPAAQLLALMLETFSHKPFSRESFANLLAQHYDLDAAAALEEAQITLTSWMKQGIVVAEKQKESYEPTYPHNIPEHNFSTQS